MEKLQQMLDAKLTKKDELGIRSKETESIEELRSINAQMDELNAEIADIRSMVEDAEKKAEEARKAETKAEEQQEARTAAINEAEEKKEDTSVENRHFDPEQGFEVRGKVDMVGSKAEQKEDRSAQAQALREGRSVTVASSDIVVPTYEAANINENFLQVSNLIDAVNILNLPGGESYTQPYELATADGDYKAEGTAYATADMTFGYAQISKAKLTAYSEMTEEVSKLPAAPYAQTILAGISRSLRKKIAKEILVGAGTTNTLVGIFSSNATAISSSSDLEVAAIDNTTLDNIVYSYGGDEAVEGSCVLILNKQDLAAFAKLRNTDGSKHHDIRPAGNGGSGTIDGIPYIINSACKAISAASGTSTGDYCMAYGNLKNYQLTIFSQMDVTKSTDYKFKEGMIAHKGVLFCGGNVVSHNGFIRVKKAAAV